LADAALEEEFFLLCEEAEGLLRQLLKTRHAMTFRSGGALESQAGMEPVKNGMDVPEDVPGRRQQTTGRNSKKGVQP
jgi:hypothetical protein